MVRVLDTLARSQANHPAQWVSWHQALAFCAWLSDALGYPVRLPTEAEWVQAATAGHPDYVYPWGREWDPERANHKESLYRLIAVGMYPDGASPAGVHDLSGNVYQWCLNEFDDLSNLEHGSKRAHPTRGGAFFTMPPNIEVRDQLSIYHRLRDNPDGTGDRGQRIAVGIRLVRSSRALEPSAPDGHRGGHRPPCIDCWSGRIRGGCSPRGCAQ